MATPKKGGKAPRRDDYQFPHFRYAKSMSTGKWHVVRVKCNDPACLCKLPSNSPEWAIANSYDNYATRVWKNIDDAASIRKIVEAVQTSMLEGTYSSV